MSRAIAAASLALFALAAVPAQSAGNKPELNRTLVQSYFPTQGDCYRFYQCFAPDSEYPACPDPTVFDICEQYPENP